MFSVSVMHIEFVSSKRSVKFVLLCVIMTLDQHKDRNALILPIEELWGQN